MHNRASSQFTCVVRLEVVGSLAYVLRNLTCQTGMLFTCDAFGMHYCSENALDVEGVKELTPHYSLYYDSLR